MKNIERSIENLSTSRVIPAIALLAFLALHSQGYCDNAAATGEMNTMADTVVNTIFAPWVRKTALAVGGGLGLFQSISGGGWKPLVGWGGLGIFINYIPKVINFLSGLGG